VRGVRAMKTLSMNSCALTLLVATLAGAMPAAAQNGTPAPSELAVPADYVIGPDDVLGVVFWREPDMSGDATVRPDGKITVPVIGEVQAAGLQPAELQAQIHASAKKYLTDVNVAVVVREINSRKIFVTGQVKAPGAFPLTNQLTVLQAIALAGGLQEYADEKNITILRQEGSQRVSLKFNYKDVSRGKKLEQNIVLRPGDTVVVP
jgi:polysaccharide export outer membrane protein